ncbi:MAG: hypothetical protein JWM19_1008 [Actinomycetia bacterium]|nr:hypothetical protein [Actinomycetes bacterium]
MTTPAGTSSSLQLPGTFAIPAVAPVYADGIPVALAGTSAAPSSPGQRFWSSQPRPAGDPTAEELTVSLGQARLVNYVTLSLPRFPHAMSAWWWDGSQWQPLLGSNGAPLVITTSGSVPAVVDNPAALNAGLNPYHYGAGHWVAHDEPVQPVTTTMLMFRLTRLAVTSGSRQFPVNPAGKRVPYPLGISGLDFGTRLLSSADAPASPRSPVTRTMRQPFTTTTDVNGSPVQVAVRENRASDLLNGATWRSGPQPTSHAVACLYLDARDPQGNAQLIDRFYLEPVTSGVRFSLYYSPVPPPPGTSFTALDDPLAASLLTASGASLPSAGPQGISFPAAPGWLTLSNQAAGTVADAPWWTAIEVMPAFGSSDPGAYVIADAGLLQLSFSAGAWSVTVPAGGSGTSNQPSGGVLAQWAFEFAAGDRLQFTAGYDGTQLFAWSSQGGTLFQAPVTPPVPPAPAFRFGGLQGIDPATAVLAGNYTLTAFVLKQEQVSWPAGTIPADFTAFAADAAAYIFPPTPAGQPSTRNAVARFSPDFIAGAICPWGFVGGLGAAYESCPWVPVQRDYVLSRGYVEFSPVLAAAWKFEFTRLSPEPFEYLQSSPREFSMLPVAAQAANAATASPTAAAAIDPGLAVNQAIAPSVQFSDAAPAPRPRAAGTVLPTEALYAPDPVAAASMAAAGGSLYNFQPWQAGSAPLAATGGPSFYPVADIPVISRVAYFVALSSIAMYRIDYTAADDTDQYLDLFADAANISADSLTPGGWTLQPGTGLVAPGNISGGAQVQSAVLNSSHAVTGVQFATVQSPPVQLLDDPDFSAPGFASWGPVGDALPLATAAASSQLGTMASVTRGSASGPGGAPLTWAGLESSYASWQVLSGAVPSWYDFSLPPVTSTMGGIGYTGVPVPTSGAGRLYVAARVFSPVALSAPLYLQLLDGATGTVIAEEPRSVSGGTVTEWFAGFTIGQGTVSENTWQEVSTSYGTWLAIGSGNLTWSQADTSIAPLGTTVTAQLVQLDSTSDTWDVDNISVFDDGLLWQFSNDGGQTWYPAYDIRNDPRGVLPFPPAQPGQGTRLMWSVAASYPGLTVSSLAVRPWYASWPHGILPRAAGVGHGPNLAPLDHYAPVEDDPRWQLSSSPVPEDWFFGTRQALGISGAPGEFPGPAGPPPDVTLGDALVWEPPAVAAQEPQTFSDIFSDVYTDTYGPADAGDVYTDGYADAYGQDYLVITGMQRQAAASLPASPSLFADAVRLPLPAFGLGADLGNVAASDPAVTSWTSGTGLPLPARRIALGNQVPATLAASAAAGDAGVRRVLFDVRPDATTTPAQLGAFLSSCQDGGLEASVSIWAGADAAFASPQDWAALLPAYVAVIHQAGYQHVLTVDNSSIQGGWLSAWYPGDDLVDVIAPTFWCTGPAPGSGAPNLAVAAAFADAHGKPLGLAGFGSDHARFTSAQAGAFIAYVQALFTARRKAATQSYDLIWLGTGTYSVITAPPGVLGAYQQLAAAL